MRLEYIQGTTCVKLQLYCMIKIQTSNICMFNSDVVLETLDSSECMFSGIYESTVTLLCAKRQLQRSGGHFS